MKRKAKRKDEEGEVEIDGAIWVGLSLNPHPLKPEGAAPMSRGR
jgi:hypothetical protein